ncbi:ribbon-helix-helix protein, CopG family [Caldicellulosiruptor acetigenus]|uniref:ribbon-helix-helix protein, CopG family n=1 Tax=Caldicellulosiruptor acetigenus TaxID=301953 RepID=UPI0003FBB498|nr:ribbon-helix-helix protein, CopG family [Caldicellulosiruptor acetigenus]WAM36074.1 ribbon-helix-helix protein, CopG family [Caldicellulosiruptor acetigenus]
MMSKTTTVRVDVETYEGLKKLSQQLNQPMQKIIQEALAEYKRKVLLSATAEAFSALREKRELWQEEIEERQLWESTLQDGIEK